MSNIEAVLGILKKIEFIASNKNTGIGTPAEVGLAREAAALLQQEMASVAEQRAAFNLSFEASYHLHHSNFESGTQAVYSKRIRIIETPNDTTHEISIDKAEPLPTWSQEELDEAVAQGHIEAWNLDVVFQDLVNKGVLEPGKYYVRVSW